MTGPSVEKGSIFVYRAFDVSEEIDLLSVERDVAELSTSRLGIAPGGQQAIIMRNPPVRLGLGEVSLRAQGESAIQPRKCGVSATLCDYGVISIRFQLDIPAGTAWSQLLGEASQILGDSETNREFDALAREKCALLAGTLKKSIKRPQEWGPFEDYVLYFFQKLEGVTTGSELLERADLAALILGEPKEPLSQKSRAGILENVYQYAHEDLVVIDWNSAVVLEPSGKREVPDILEFALTHLLEFRFYDDMLDRRLGTLYDEIERRRRGIWRSHFAAISREAGQRYIEFSEFLERIDNSLKVVGDFYLAVIFRGAIRRFRIPDWQQSVTRKMNLLARVSELLQGEVNVHRGHTLELVIIVLIVFELLSAFLRSH